MFDPVISQASTCDEEFTRALAQVRREQNAEDAMAFGLSLGNPLSISRYDFVDRTLAEFESYLSPRVGKPLRVILADDSAWSSEQRAVLQPTGYPHQLIGGYMFVDTCPPEDPAGSIVVRTSGIYSVVRYIGSATNHFYDRVRKANWADAFRLRFQHRWIDIVPVPSEVSFLVPALEAFLLTRIRTTHNDNCVPIALKELTPFIFTDTAP